MPQEISTPVSLFGRTSPVPSHQMQGATSEPSSMKWLTAGRWSANGQCWMHRTSECPSDGAESFSSLSSILESQPNVPTRYYLSARAAQGILRRAEKRGRQLPPLLATALALVAQTTIKPKETT